jgi:hypothetical protein
MPKPKRQPSDNLEVRTDPLQVNVRIYRQVARLLEQLEEGEHVTLRERFQALMAIARIQYVFVQLRKEKVGDDGTAGSSVRKYATAFKAHDPRGRKKAPRSTVAQSEPEPDDNWFERDDDGADDGDAA